jgi:hypothetical protein
MPQALGSQAHTLPPLAELLGVWLSAFLTLAIFSFLYGDNPVYKLAEHLFVGISAGYGVVMVYYESVLKDMIYPLFRPEKVGLEHPNYWLVIPIGLGLMMLARFVPRYEWLARWPIAFAIGLGAGAFIPSSIQQDLLVQLRETVVPLWSRSWQAGVGKEVCLALSNLLLAGGVVCTLSYFFFSRPHRGLLGAASRVGIWFLMVAFGAGFGNTVMARLSLLIGRVEFLRYEWWPTLGPLLRALAAAVGGLVR